MESEARLTKNVIRIGSRTSELAMLQTTLVRDEMLKLHPTLTFEIVGINTKGDKILNVALSKIGTLTFAAHSPLNLIFVNQLM